ncbi:MAG: Rrf2 family transcriptional regulator [Planctomycetota bacterium]
MPSLAPATGYAVLGLGYLAAAAGKPALVRDIASACDLPAPYLAKTLNRLGRAGIVKTRRGIHGGVSLARAAAELTLYEVCEALDDPILENRCLLGTDECSERRACPAHAFRTKHREQAMTFLRETTIADVASFETQRRWAALASMQPTTNGNSISAG